MICNEVIRGEKVDLLTEEDFFAWRGYRNKNEREEARLDDEIVEAVPLEINESMKIESKPLLDLCRLDFHC